MEKTGSFSRNTTESDGQKHKHHCEETDSGDNIRSPKSPYPATNSSFADSLRREMEPVDGFIETLYSSDAAEHPPEEIPAAVESFPETVDSLVSKMESSGFGRDEDDDSVFIEALNRISKSVIRLRELNRSDSTGVSSWLNRASSVQHRAVSFLDDEFRRLLEGYQKNSDANINSDRQNEKGTPKSHKQGSFNSVNSVHESDRCVLPDRDPTQPEEDEDRFPDFPPETISAMNKIAGAMISAGYEAESCLLYEISRRHAFKDELGKLGFEGINVEDVQKMTWETLETEIATWISMVRHCSTVLFPGERKLCDAVFASSPTVPKRLFTDLVSAVTIRFLDFSGAVVLTKRSSEKLFKLLDMYETLRDLVPAMDDSASDLINEINLAQSRLGEAVVSIFSELENSIKSDNGRTPVPSGTVHPLTRYTMNYLKYACEYKETLEQVFEHHEKTLSDQTDPKPEPDETKPNNDNHQDPDNGDAETSPFAKRMMRVLDILDANLDMKSKLYRDLSLRYIFLMNNGRYILQKIKGSQEIRDLMGASRIRKCSSELRQYHKSYQRETWGKVLQCMNQEGIQVNGKISKLVLKERFKCFNVLFDEIHKTQSTWIVSDEQMQSELRVSISAVVIPAYRSFLGRFKQHLDTGKQASKYIKYQPEDIEAMIEELFDGNPNSMVRRRN
ncbi:PREDICTED: exocyst complex component EXO70B1 [Tarenaya hassleriana]|uniref:exocyst complex component EXO70B1 n=1 Tax=Tarenaya hassleriana TaxID=28532 RepID=UPI00053C22F7|nr:PREDICTED: exocyst complex component EXO70B1 [Tarenaya hassleriana]